MLCRVLCAVQGAVCCAGYCVLCRVLCAVQGTVCCAWYCVLCRVLCAVQDTVCCAGYSVLCRVLCVYKVLCAMQSTVYHACVGYATQNTVYYACVGYATQSTVYRPIHKPTVIAPLILNSTTLLIVAMPHLLMLIGIIIRIKIPNSGIDN